MSLRIGSGASLTGEDDIGALPVHGPCVCRNLNFGLRCEVEIYLPYRIFAASEAFPSSFLHQATEDDVSDLPFPQATRSGHFHWYNSLTTLLVVLSHFSNRRKQTVYLQWSEMQRISRLGGRAQTTVPIVCKPPVS